MKDITFTYELGRIEYVQLFMESLTPWIESMGFEIDVLPNGKEWHAKYIGNGIRRRRNSSWIDDMMSGINKDLRRTLVFKIEVHKIDEKTRKFMQEAFGEKPPPKEAGLSIFPALEPTNTFNRSMPELDITVLEDLHMVVSSFIDYLES